MDFWNKNIRILLDQTEVHLIQHTTSQKWPTKYAQEVTQSWGLGGGGGGEESSSPMLIFAPEQQAAGDKIDSRQECLTAIMASKHWWTLLYQEIA